MANFLETSALEWAQISQSTKILKIHSRKHFQTITKRKHLTQFDYFLTQVEALFFATKIGYFWLKS